MLDATTAWRLLLWGVECVATCKAPSRGNEFPAAENAEGKYVKFSLVPRIRHRSGFFEKEPLTLYMTNGR